MQLEFLTHNEDTLRRSLEEHFGESLDLRITDNTSSILTYSASENGAPNQLRLHRMFLAAGPNILSALAMYLTKRRSRKSAALIDTFIEGNRHLIRKKRGAALRLRTSGRHHNLQAYYDAVNVEHFEGSIGVPITWGKLPSTPRRRSIRLGSYTPEDHLIRIHPHLDQAFVPEYFVRYVVFHEMLHVHVGIKISPTGRRMVHTREFNRIERMYHDYDRAVAWHNTPKNLNRLLRHRPEHL